MAAGWFGSWSGRATNSGRHIYETCNSQVNVEARLRGCKERSYAWKVFYESRTTIALRNMWVSEGMRDIPVTTRTLRSKMAFPRNRAASKSPYVPKNRMRVT